MECFCPQVQCYNRVKVSALEVITHSPEETRALGQKIGARIREGDLICLSGELGAGKTTLVIGIGNGWGAQQIVNSPTYVFVNEYTNLRGRRLYHVDAYRLRDSADAQSIALDAMLDDPQSAILIEWAERVQKVLPTEYLWIDISPLDDLQRRIKIEARGERYKLFL